MVQCSHQGGDYVLYHRIFLSYFSCFVLRDNRSLWNPALAFVLLFSYMSIANLFYEAGQKEVHMVFFAGFFLLLPL